MNVGRSVTKAIDDWMASDLESAMLHACNAIDGTAKKLHPTEGSNSRFTRLLRDNYAIFGPMGAPGLDLTTQRFPVTLERPKAPGGQSDIADVIYGIHRCGHGHGDALPAGFELVPDALTGASHTSYWIGPGAVRLSDRAIFGLLAVAVTSPVNIGQRAADGYYLTFNGDQRYEINDWWGRAEEFASIVGAVDVPVVRLDLNEWMENPPSPGSVPPPFDSVLPPLSLDPGQPITIVMGVQPTGGQVAE